MDSRSRFRTCQLRVAPRFFAAVLMLLIVLPFTSPFASCDVASLTGESAAPAGTFDAKPLKEEATAGIVAAAPDDLAIGRPVCTVPLARDADLRPVPLTVLRV